MDMNFFRRFFLMTGVLTVLGLATLPVSAATINESTSIGEDAYWQLVQSSLETVSRLDGLPDKEIKQKLADLASQWEAVTEVNVNGQVIPVDNGYLIGLLRADEPDLEQIGGLLNALLAAHEKQPARIFSTADLEPLHAILSLPEFAWAQPAPNPLSDWLQKLLEALDKLWRRIFGDEPVRIPVNNTVLSVIATVILIVVFVFIFRSLFNDFIKEEHLNGDEDGENVPLTAESAFEKAQTLSRGGDYRSAVRYLYLSSLLALDERGVLRYDRSKTNREYLRSVSNSPELAAPLGEVIEVFDTVWYGYHSLEDESFQRYSDRVKELKEKRS